LDIRDILAVDLVGLADPAVNFQNFVDLHVVRLESSVGYDRAHVEFSLTLGTTWELVGCLFDCGLSSEAVKTEKVVAGELYRIFKDLQADSTAHLLI
jgi:hypothetical protein